MNVTSKYIKDVVQDFDILTNPLIEESKAIHDERVKSLALRLIGLVSIAFATLSFGMGALSLLRFAPVSAVGWTAIGAVAIVSGHDLIQLGSNKREKLLVAAALEQNVRGQRVEAVGRNSEAVSDDDLSCHATYMRDQHVYSQLSRQSPLKGTWVLELVYHKLEALQREVAYYQEVRRVTRT